MKKTTLLLTLCMAVATSVQAGKYLSASIQKEIKTSAEKKWPGDYDMQLYEIRNQEESFTAFHEMRWPSGMPTREFDAIKKRAEIKWPKDYDMQFYELKNQIKAWLELNGN